MQALMPFFAQLAVSVLAWYLKSKGVSDQNKRDYMAFVEIMDRLGIASVRMRLEASKQKDRIDEMWEEEAAKDPNPIDKLQGR